jgi:MATE family multidrug resistance protein
MQFGKIFDSLLERINYKKRKTPDTESTPLIREDLDFKYSGNTKKPLEWGDSGYGLNTISNGNKLTKEQIYIEAVALLKFCFPLLVTFLLGHGMRLVDVWFLGKIGSEGIFFFEKAKKKKRQMDRQSYTKNKK